MGELLHVSSSPHIRSKVTTDYLMKMVIVALMPATVAGVCFFGWKALLLVCLSVATCVATEGIYETLMHKPLTIWDHRIVTGSEPSGIRSLVDPGDRWRFCYSDRKTAVWWFGTEYHEPGAGSKMFPAVILYRTDD